jgi:tetratricopeptide (TPR) repeat protein
MTHRLDQADALLTEGKYEEAIGLLEAIRAEHPDEDPVLLRLAWASWDNGDKNRSVEYWETLLDRELQNKVFTGFAYDELVRIYKQDRRIDRLVVVCENAVLVQPEDVGLLTELGNAYLLSGRNDQACEIFSKLTSMEEDNPAFYLRLAEAMLAAGKADACREAFEQAAKIDPDDADRYFFLAADLHMKRNDNITARHLLEKCLEIAPANSLYYCSLGDILIALTQVDEAFAAYETACQYNRSHSAAYYNRLGNALMKAGLFDRAVVAFETALSFDAATPCRQHLAAAHKASG